MPASFLYFPSFAAFGRYRERRSGAWQCFPFGLGEESRAVKVRDRCPANRNCDISHSAILRDCPLIGDPLCLMNLAENLRLCFNFGRDCLPPYFVGIVPRSSQFQLPFSSLHFVSVAAIFDGDQFRPLPSSMVIDYNHHEWCCNQFQWQLAVSRFHRRCLLGLQKIFLFCQ